MKVQTGGRTAIASWSGGKDSCLALHRAIGAGVRVTHLLNFVSEETGRCCFHGVPAGLIALQAERMGLPLVQTPMPEDMRAYESAFRKTVGSFTGIRGVVFGDVYLDEHKTWVERVCGDMGLEAIEPLWGKRPADLMAEFIAAGFCALVVSARADLFGGDAIGRVVDREWVGHLRERGICVCGENGEFHTVVVDGPLFQTGIRIEEAKVVLKDGFWKHWSLDIRRFA